MSKKENEQKLKSRWYLIGICALTTLVFSSNFNGDFLIFDDNQYFEDYPEVTQLSWESVGKYFTKHYVIMYHPLPILSFAVQYQIHGLNPTPFHLFNFIFHLVNVLLVFAFVKSISDNEHVALLTALIFAIHPMTTEAVSWISARSSTMFTCFFIASLITYWKYLNKSHGERWKWFILSFIFALLSFFSKVNALPLPFVLLLLDWYGKRKWSANTILDKIPFFAIAIIFGLIAISDSGTVDNLSKGNNDFGIFEGLLFSCYSVGNYMVQFFVPAHLAAIHTYPIKEDELLPSLYYLSPILILTSAYSIYLFRKNEQYVFGLLFFSIIISVTLQIIPSRLFMMADRYTYLPYVGFAFILSHGIFKLKADIKPKRKKIGGQLLLAIILWSAVLSIVSFHRNKVWNDTETLISDIIEKNDEHPYLARAYGIRASTKEGRKDSRGALADLNKAISLRKDEGETYYNRGQIYFRMARYDLAKRDFLEAEKLLGMHFTLANFLGGCEYNVGNYVSALEYYNEAVQLNPNYAEAIQNRGSVHANLNDYEDALKDFSRAIELTPDNQDAIKFRGFVYLKLNNREKACADLLRAKHLGATDVEPFISSNNCTN